MLKGRTFNHFGELRVKDSFAQDWSPYKLASKKRSWLPAKLCKRSYPMFKAINSIHPEGLELRHLIMPGERPVLPATTNTKPAGLGWSQGSDIYIYCTLAPYHTRGGANALLIRWLKNPRALHEALCASPECEMAMQELHICFLLLSLFPQDFSSSLCAENPAFPCLLDPLREIYTYFTLSIYLPASFSLEAGTHFIHLRTFTRHLLWAKYHGRLCTGVMNQADLVRSQ